MKYTICTIIKNEQNYLEEWLKYHFSKGFIDIYLFEDINSTSHKSITDKFTNVYLHQYIEIDTPFEVSRQYTLFKWFYTQYKSKYDWCAFIDVDEYINFDNNYTLDTFLKEFEKYNGVYIWWKMYNANGLVYKTKNITENYTKWILPVKKYSFKSIVNFNKDIEFKNIHKVKKGVFTDYSNKISSPIYSKCWINHYFTKSLEDWIERFTKRGDVLPGNRKIEEFFIYNPDMKQYEKYVYFKYKNYLNKIIIVNYYICAIIKDEQLYLKEWLDYHLSIGFTEIHLYEDFTSTSHKDITDNYFNVYLHPMSEVPGCEPDKVGRQVAVYNHFCKTHNSGWCLFTDIDEYLRLEDNVTLDSLTNEFKDEVGIEIWWKCYGANGHIERPYGSIQKAYSDDYLINWDPCWQFKSFVNLENASKYTNQQSHFVNCHYHKRIVTTEYKRGDFRQNRNKLNKTFHLCWIDHYISKSWEDYVERLKRGNITKGLRDVDYFFRLNPTMLKYREELTKDLDESLFPTI